MRAAIQASHLRSLPDDVVTRLTVGARAVRLDAGRLVRHEGDSAPHLDLVVAGLVRVFVSAPDGRTMTVRYVRSGGLLGAVSLFTSPFALPATIQTLTEAQLLRFVPLVVRQAADTDVRVARALIDELSERVLSFIPEIPSGAFATVRQRVARHLLDLAAAGPASAALVADASQQELADAAGTVREVVVRALRDLRSSGVIRTGRGGVTILDPERLAAEAHGAGTAGGHWNQSS